MSQFPAMKWHPNTGESQVFKAAQDVPEGWLDHHPADPDYEKEAVGAAPKTPAKIATGSFPEAPVMSRDEIKTALDAAEIPYAKNAKDATLYDILLTSLRQHLAAQNVAFTDDMNAKQLLALVPPSTE